MKGKPHKKDKKDEEDDDLLKQSNKSHKGLREKIKKKRQQEKEIKKKKKEKKKENEMKKLKKKLKKEKKDDSDSDGPDNTDKGETKLLKYIKRLKIFMEEEADDLFEMFESIDAGGEVDVEGLENGKVKNYLKKIFKYLGLRKNPETKEYSKHPDIHSEPIKKKIQDLWYQGVDTSESGSDNEMNKSKNMEEEQDLEEKEIEKEIDLEKARKALLEGVKDIPEDQQRVEEEVEIETVQAKPVPKGEEWRNFLDDKFGSILGQEDKTGYSKLGKKGPSQSDRTEKDKKVDEFMQDYNAQFRKKTLLEEHQERKRAGAAGKPVERRAFDRDLDVNMSRIDSKKVFQMLNNKDNNLSTRFGNSSSGNKYL